jgi:hypothetical protein
MIDLTGKRFGRWVVQRLASSPNPGAHWLCLCDCGTSRVVDGHGLRRGRSESCGCLFSYLKSFRMTRHGHTNNDKQTTEYTIWRGMIRRCLDPNSTPYSWYGGRGITVCDRWKIFDNFLADMGFRPNGKTLERVNNDGNYEPGNVVWATRKEQAQNRRTRRAA